MRALQSKRLSDRKDLISLDDLKDHLEVEHDEDDDLIAGMCAAASDAITGVDTVYQRVWMHETWRDFWPDFSRFPLLRLAPVAALDRVAYIDTSGDEILLDKSAFYLVEEAGGSRVCPSEGVSLPRDVADRPNAVMIDYIAGYGPLQADAPARVIQSVKLTVGHWYRHRESVVLAKGAPVELPQAVEFLLQPLRRIGVEAWRGRGDQPGGFGQSIALGRAADLE